MREFLFRGQKVENGEWVEGPGIDLTFDVAYILTKEEDYSGYHLGEYDVIPETIGQWTGLTDKNGKKIFEGDIVKCRHHWQLRVYPREGIDEEKYFFEQKIRGAYGKSVDKENVFIPCERHYYFRNYVVEYFARNGGFRVRNGGQFHALIQSYIYNRNLEVIGNIYDNPELLKGGEG